jgi:SsrA-binding protein
MPAERTLAVNRRARHDYTIDETVEAGLVLTGTEIKSLRAGKASLAEAYARIEHGETWLIGAHIAEWPGASRANHEPRRPRKLLLHRGQIGRLAGQTQAKGFTLVPLRIYVGARGHAKIELGLGRGKKQYDRRREIAARDARRQLERDLAETGRRHGRP